MQAEHLIVAALDLYAAQLKNAGFVRIATQAACVAEEIRVGNLRIVDHYNAGKAS